MAAYFLETSALAKLYVQEQGTETMLEIAGRSPAPAIIVLSLSRVELRSAIRRRSRMGEIDAGAAADALTLFESHLSSIYLIQPVSDVTLELAAQLIDRYPLKAYDAIQLAGYLQLVSQRRDLLFVSADDQLISAAFAEGVETINANR